MKRIIHLPVISNAFGISIFIIGIFMLSALPFAIYFNENTVLPFLVSAGVTIITGGLFWGIFKKKKITDMGERDAFVIVSVTWFAAGLFGALPYLLSNTIPHFADAFFESVSGFTTTGASVLTDIESMPKSILYWRSLTQWLGGMGILVLVIAVLPNLASGEVKLFIAEAPVASGNKIHPQIRQTALRLWFVYSFLSFAMVAFLMYGNMNFFESVCHSFSTLSTGGFSPKNNSVEGYSSYIQIVFIVFMCFGGMNFVIHYWLLKGRIRKMLRNEELKMFIIFIVIISFGFGAILVFNEHYTEFSDALRHGFFQCVSILTTTGFYTSDYVLWPQMTWLILFLLFFTGGMTGSTSGGIKFTRHYVLLKNIRKEVRKFIHPRAIIPIKIDNITVEDNVINNYYIIFVIYILTFCIGSLVMTFFTQNIPEAFGVTMACLGAIGPAFGDFGPTGNYSQLHDGGKYFLSFLMVLGRIEILPFLLIFTRYFRKP